MSENLVTDQDPPKDTVKEEETDKDGDTKMTDQTTDDSVEEWRTPESEKNKIPAIEDCPPAPGKPRVTRLFKVDGSPAAGMEFFENKGCQEVETFFDSCMENSRAAAANDGRLSLKKRLFDTSSSVNDRKA